MSDKPMMKIIYQVPLGGDGKGLSFELAVAAEVTPEALGIHLDVMGGEARRQWAIEQLPQVKADLFVNMKLLDDQKKGRAAAAARQQVKVDRNSANRRREAQPLPSDAAAVAQFDARIMDIMGHIEAGKKLIPRLERMIAREPETEPFPEIYEPEAIAAE